MKLIDSGDRKVKVAVELDAQDVANLLHLTGSMAGEGNIREFSDRLYGVLVAIKYRYHLPRPYRIGDCEFHEMIMEDLIPVQEDQP